MKRKMQEKETTKSFLMRQFDRARMKLTLIYLAISGSIVIIFSIAALNAQHYAVGRVLSVLEAQAQRTERQAVARLLGQRLEQFDTAFKERLIVVNIVILVGAGVASYILSGYSLRSIRENLEKQEEFAADASHELRTPLTTISMEIVALQKTHKRLPPPIKEALTSIQQEVERMQKIVSGLLTLVRQDEDDTPIGRAPVTNINTVVKESVKQMNPLASAKKVKINARLNGTANTRIEPAELKQICLILIDNAIKYTPAKGKIHVTVTSERRNHVLTVQDTGVGIPESDLPHIFERFYRVQRLQGSVAKGAGLGLTIARKLVEASHGSIQIESKIGKGTRVILRFPR
jgi:two-component system sensor histidine kinase CiaH